MNDQQVKAFKKQIINEKHDVLSHLQTKVNNQGTELSNYDNHPGDHGTALHDQTLNFSFEQQEKQHLAKLNHALNRIKEGEYGKCEVCGEEIEMERLEAIPSTTTCIKDADEHRESNVFVSNSGLELDDSDVLKELEKFGTSDDLQGVEEKKNEEINIDNVSNHSRYQ